MEFKLDSTTKGLTLGNGSTAVVPPDKSPKQARNGGELLNAYRKEMDNFYKEMRNFHSEDPAVIFREIAAMTARFSHIRSQIVRAESKVWQNFRTKEVDPFIEECDRQFKIWSRAFSVQTLDWEMTKGV